MLIGIYGISGAGKSHLLEALKKSLVCDTFSFFEGADEIASLLDGDLTRFDIHEKEKKTALRELAISSIQDKCAEQGKIGVVAGHFMLWSEKTMSPVAVHTEQDFQTFTHILYLDTEPELIAHRRQQDLVKKRGSLDVGHLRKWQEAEKEGLRKACYNHSVLFISIGASNTNAEYVVELLRSFQNYTEEENLRVAEARLHSIMAQCASPPEAMLVLDADRTLTPSDSGYLFWQNEGFSRATTPLRDIFSSRLDYSHAAFRQAAALYHERYSSNALEDICQQIAPSITLYPQMASLLSRVVSEKRVGAVVITCGLQSVWEKVLALHGLSSIHVFGAGRLNDLVVDGRVKASLVTLLREQYGARVTAFGDSPLDLAMLSRANEAIVVVGSEAQRSKRMDLELSLAIYDGQIKAKQALMCPGTSHRLNTRMLPLVDLDKPDFLARVLGGCSPSTKFQMIHKTDKGAAKLLMTPMRDATIAGPALRKAHHQTGWYLATDVLPEVLGVEEYDIPHVQGHSTKGHRIEQESSTLIVALMRGGEPIASGVNDALSKATFLHAKCAQDLTCNYLEHKSAVILVDSVINSGKSMVEFLERIRELSSTVAIVMIAGVVQSQSISALKSVQERIRCAKLTLIALRISENKYTGSGGTDTGNRLFNTLTLN